MSQRTFATGTNAATESGVLTQKEPQDDSPGQPLRLKDIDLTTIFNQAATDLDDEEISSEPPTVASHVIGSRLAQTLYIPSDYVDHVEHMVQSYPFVPRIVVEANEYWNFLKANMDSTWHAQGCPKGFLRRQSLLESHSRAVFLELLGLSSERKAGESLLEGNDGTATRNAVVGVPTQPNDKAEDSDDEGASTTPFLFLIAVIAAFLWLFA